jgi:hypothetical protein
MDIPKRPMDRFMAFLDEYFDAPNDADLELRIGMIGNDIGSAEPAIGIMLNGKMHGFTIKEARVMAAIAEDAMHAHPNEPDAKGLPNLILMLRTGADKAEAERR